MLKPCECFICANNLCTLVCIVCFESLICTNLSKLPVKYDAALNFHLGMRRVPHHFFTYLQTTHMSEFDVTFEWYCTYASFYYCTGSGKTTFLDLLTGRRKYGNITVIDTNV